MRGLKAAAQEELALVDPPRNARRIGVLDRVAIPQPDRLAIATRIVRALHAGNGVGHAKLAPDPQIRVLAAAREFRVPAKAFEDHLHLLKIEAVDAGREGRRGNHDWSGRGCGFAFSLCAAGAAKRNGDDDQGRAPHQACPADSRAAWCVIERTYCARLASLIPPANITSPRSSTASPATWAEAQRGLSL